MSTLLPSRTDDAVAFLSERAQFEADERALAAWEREQCIERAVTFADLLEELATTVSPEDGADFMECLASPDRVNVSAMCVTLSNAKEAIVKRRLAQGD